MFWNSAGDDDDRSIGVDVKRKTTAAKIVDGQQRLTSLYAVMTGEPVVDHHYRSESHAAFKRLSDPHYQPLSRPTGSAAPEQETVVTSSLSELVAAGLIKPGDFWYLLTRSGRTPSPRSQMMP